MASYFCDVSFDSDFSIVSKARPVNS